MHKEYAYTHTYNGVLYILHTYKYTHTHTHTHDGFLFFFTAAPAAHGSSQARGQIRADATATAGPDPSRVCDLPHSSQQHWILNPEYKAQGPNPHPHGC